MRDQLNDMTKQLAPLFKKAKVIASDPAHTRVEAHDDDRILLVFASFKEMVKEFHGDFGISNLAMLGQLLNVPSFKHDEAEMLVHGEETITEFEFRDGKSGSHIRYTTMNPRLLGLKDMKMADIAWNVKLAPSKSNLAEFAHFAGILSDTPQFGVKLEDGTLYATIGTGAAGTHSACVALADHVEGKFSAPTQSWNTRQFLAILKNAPGANPCEVRFSERGIASITVDTEHGMYNYILRAKPA